MPAKPKVMKSKKPAEALSKYQKVLDKVRRDARFKNKEFKEQQLIASKIYHKTQ
jgi:hypothetical protein